MGTLAKPGDSLALMRLVQSNPERFEKWSEEAKEGLAAAANAAYGSTVFNLRDLVVNLRKDQLIQTFGRLIARNNGPFETWPDEEKTAAKEALTAAGRSPESAKRLVFDFTAMTRLAQEGCAQLRSRLFDINYCSSMAGQVALLSPFPLHQESLANRYEFYTGVSWEHADVLMAYAVKLLEGSSSTPS